MRPLMVTLAMICAVTGAGADMPDASFPSIDGGTLAMRDWQGKPVLVVNTASQCGFTGQYEDLQTLYDTYRAKGLVVLAIPSDDFNQELESAEEVKEFCDIAFGLDLPMTDILSVKGADAHPLYQTIEAETGFVPRWNFNKVLFSPDGAVAATWDARTSPMSRPVTDAIEGALAER